MLCYIHVLQLQRHAVISLVYHNNVKANVLAIEMYVLPPSIGWGSG